MNPRGGSGVEAEKEIVNVEKGTEAEAEEEIVNAEVEVEDKTMNETEKDIGTMAEIGYKTTTGIVRGKRRKIEGHEIVEDMLSLRMQTGECQRRELMATCQSRHQMRCRNRPLPHLRLRLRPKKSLLPPRPNRQLDPMLLGVQA